MYFLCIYLSCYKVRTKVLTSRVRTSHKVGTLWKVGKFRVVLTTSKDCFEV